MPGYGLPAPLQLFIGRRGRQTAGHLKSTFHDFLRRTTRTAGECRLQQFLSVR
jgi:hypothetical protein